MIGPFFDLTGDRHLYFLANEQNPALDTNQTSSTLWFQQVGVPSQYTVGVNKSGAIEWSFIWPCQQYSSQKRRVIREVIQNIVEDF